MNEIDFASEYLAKDRGYGILILTSGKYSNYSSINTLYSNDMVVIKTFYSLTDIINHINVNKLKRVLIDSNSDLDFNSLKVEDITIPDVRIFFINDECKALKLTIKSDKYLFINVLENINKYYFVGAILQLHNLNNKLNIGISAIHGFGVFCEENIHKKEVLFKLFGEKINIKDRELSSFKGEWNALSENLLLLREERTTYGFINHSKKPNCYINSSDLTINALRNIDIGEEILLDYREEPLPEKYKNGHGSTYL